MLNNKYNVNKHNKVKTFQKLSLWIIKDIKIKILTLKWIFMKETFIYLFIKNK